MNLLEQYELLMKNENKMVTVLGPGTFVSYGMLVSCEDHVAVTDDFGRELVAIYPGVFSADLVGEVKGEKS